MFVTVKGRVLLMEKYIGYINAAKEMEGLGYILSDHKWSDYSDYYRDMRDTLYHALEGLKANSTDEKLIAKMERKVADVFADIDL